MAILAKINILNRVKPYKVSKLKLYFVFNFVEKVSLCFEIHSYEDRYFDNLNRIDAKSISLYSHYLTITLKDNS